VGYNQAGTETKLASSRVSTLTFEEMDQQKTIKVLGWTSGTLLVTSIALLIVHLVTCNCPELAIETNGKCEPIANLFPGSLHQSLERTDRVQVGSLKNGSALVIRNNLNERQYINSVAISAAKRIPGYNVVQATDGTLYYATSPTSTNLITVDESEQLKKRDGVYADGKFLEKLSGRTLDSEQTIEFKLKNNKSNGILLSLKNSDLYDAAFHEYMSSHADYYRSQFKKWDRDPYTPDGMRAKLRGHGVLMTVEAYDGISWTKIDEIQPVGEHFFRDVYLKISEPQKFETYRLRFFPGVWQVDQLAETNLKKEAIRVALNAKFENSEIEAKLKSMDSDRLVLNKGDSVRITPDIPAGQWDVFVEASGYYQLLIEDKPEFASSKMATVTHHKFTDFATEYFKQKVAAIVLPSARTVKSVGFLQ
jgi:hypothetical protein